LQEREPQTPHDLLDDEVEEAVEADEKLVFDPREVEESDEEFLEGQEDDKPEAMQDPAEEPAPDGLMNNYWWIACLPVCFLLFLQLLPLPTWMVGFITGAIVAAPTAAYAACKAVSGSEAEGEGRIKFLERVVKRVPKRKAIIVQEELERKYVSDIRCWSQ